MANNDRSVPFEFLSGYSGQLTAVSPKIDPFEKIQRNGAELGGAWYAIYCTNTFADRKLPTSFDAK